MEIYRNINNIPTHSATVLTIGSFDGIHRGHQEIIGRTVNMAKGKQIKSIVVTFDPHPRHILKYDSSKLPIILDLENKLSMLKYLGVDATLVVKFTSEFSKISPEIFLEKVIRKNFHPKDLVIGYDHHFGFKRKGTPSFVKDFGENFGINVEIVDGVSDEGSIISSTRIREQIRDGYVRRANFELGWVYGFNARVVRGAGRGQDLSYPTANFTPLDSNQLLPKEGVYFTRGRVVGKQLYGMCNLGTRPTFDERDFVMEVHFFDFNNINLYSQNIRIEFLERIRDEIKFESRFDLINQLNEDKTQCLMLESKYY
jgi:riboflavin kinase/FMN adenylyltransferase